VVAREHQPVLAYGRGRSYGDSCLNGGGRLLDTGGLDHFVEFDEETGVLRVEAGVVLGEIVDLLGRRQEVDGGGWFLPVSPGTSFVTVGGAIANDIHGKNHHRMGSFGCHVRALRLLRSDGEIRHCTPKLNPELFRATIGGLGLTGVILDADLQLRRVPGFSVVNEDIRFDDLDTFYALSAESVASHEYTVAWIDCLARGRHLGRGLFSRANHVPGPTVLPPTGAPKLRMSWEPPVSPLNRLTVSAFNALYWRQFWPRRRRERRLPVTATLFPLDGIADWNRLYGRRGFYQYQCVIPSPAAAAVRELLTIVAGAGEGSFLAVLKVLGERQSIGHLSFPMAGTTLALDFPNRGGRTLDLLDRLDRVTTAAGGRLYPAKDSRMSGTTLRAGYPALDAFAAQIDPAFSSSFWRRIAFAPTKPAKLVAAR
jgi:FAD/FMN-containing dehydrogenase